MGHSRTAHAARRLVPGAPSSTISSSNTIFPTRAAHHALNARTLHDELVLLAMEDVTEKRRSQQLLEQIESYAQDVVDTVREPLLILDSSLRVHSANRAFYQTFHVSSEETENQLIYELGNKQWDIPALRTLLEDIVPQSSVFNDFELEHNFPVIGRRVMLLNARKLRQGSHADLLVLAMEDVTERRRLEGEVAKAKEAAETANRTRVCFLATLGHECARRSTAILGFSEMSARGSRRGDCRISATTCKKSPRPANICWVSSTTSSIFRRSRPADGASPGTVRLLRFDRGSGLDDRHAVVAKNGNTLEITCIPPDIGVITLTWAKCAGLFNLVLERGEIHARRPVRGRGERQIMDTRNDHVPGVRPGIGLSSEQIVRLFQSFTQADASTTRKFARNRSGARPHSRFCQMSLATVTVPQRAGKRKRLHIKLPATVRESAVEPRLSTEDGCEPSPPFVTALNVTRTAAMRSEPAFWSRMTTRCSAT